MNITGYVLVSIEEQSREGVSLYNQKSKIQAYCKMKGLFLKENYRGRRYESKELKENLEIAGFSHSHVKRD